MEKIKAQILILLVLIAVFLPIFRTNATAGTSSTSNYTLLAPLPCPDGASGCSGSKLTNFNTASENSFSDYFNLMLKIFIGICAVLSVVMIIIGGMEYMTSELVHSKEAGKEKITHAILGLLIALGAYALLYTINPKLLDIKLDFRSTSGGTSTSGTSGLSTPGGATPASSPTTPFSDSSGLTPAPALPASPSADSSSILPGRPSSPGDLDEDFSIDGSSGSSSDDSSGADDYGL